MLMKKPKFAGSYTSCFAQNLPLSSNNDNRWACRYLQDFNETAYNLSTGEAHAVDFLAWNPLVGFQILWRFEKFVKKWRNSDHQQQVGETCSSEFLSLRHRSFGPFQAVVFTQRFVITWPRCTTLVMGRDTRTCKHQSPGS